VLFWIGLAVSLVGLWLALRTVEFDKLARVLTGALSTVVVERVLSLLDSQSNKP
jgi:hypothetical protein